MVVPIYQTSTYVQEEVGVHKGYEYSRSRQPDPHRPGDLPGRPGARRSGLAFASGLAAEDTLLRTVLEARARTWSCPNDAYGGTFRLFDKVLTRWGVEHTPVPLGDLDAVRAALRPDTG